MQRFRRRLRDFNFARLWLGLLTAWFFVVISGLPLPMLQEVIRDSDITASGSSVGGKIHRIEKDRSQPFPCMFSRCGCNNAEQCWRQCCCHDLSSKLAWAKRNHVLPPDYVIAEARQKGLLGENELLAAFSESPKECENDVATTQSLGKEAKPTCPHCALKSKSAKPCCSIAKIDAKEEASCCNSQSATEPHSVKPWTCCSTKTSPDSDSQVSESAPASRSVIILQSMRCRGSSLNLLGFAPMLPVEQAEIQVFETRLIGRFLVVSERFTGHSFAPITPPPWV